MPRWSRAWQSRARCSPRATWCSSSSSPHGAATASASPPCSKTSRVYCASTPRRQQWARWTASRSTACARTSTWGASPPYGPTALTGRSSPSTPGPSTRRRPWPRGRWSSSAGTSPQTLLRRAARRCSTSSCARRPRCWSCPERRGRGRRERGRSTAYARSPCASGTRRKWSSGQPSAEPRAPVGLSNRRLSRTWRRLSRTW
mmetsp:Transcript_2166/g.6520  ORF Transcript_2166/g.6520 Transcript_2166/m.6520 type:complete len:202 (+) Transcript_2166:426-1031(+)